MCIFILSDQISRSVVSDSLQPHESQHARPPSPSPTPGVHSDSHPWSQWCHPAISCSVVPFSSCPQSHPASESFPMSQESTYIFRSSSWAGLKVNWLPFLTLSLTFAPSETYIDPLPSVMRNEALLSLNFSTKAVIQLMDWFLNFWVRMICLKTVGKTY